MIIQCEGADAYFFSGVILGIYFGIFLTLLTLKAKQKFKTSESRKVR